MNFAKGITECRIQTYKHLKNLLKPIPLQTPTVIELSPGEEICVTLFDANHMPGAASFLIEGKRGVGNGRAILYTGDIRAESWWVNRLAGHVAMVPYTTHPRQKRLNTVYLDTTFAAQAPQYQHFPTKAGGIAELLQQIRALPNGTVFYFNAWTFGYEEVWLALSRALDTQVHLDAYRHGIYQSLQKSLGPGLECHEAPVLCGVKVGNHTRRGIVTENAGVTLHCCELGTGCPVMGHDGSQANVIQIRPIISRHHGKEIPEVGAGGGQGDLNQLHEIDLSDQAALVRLEDYCKNEVADGNMRQDALNYLHNVRKRAKRSLVFDVPHLDKFQSEQITLDTLLATLIKPSGDQGSIVKSPKTTPKMITFPYSRHSSYNELRHLVSTLQPLDIHPCTFPTAEYFDDSTSMASLFGDLLPEETTFAWDEDMRAQHSILTQQDQARKKRKRAEAKPTGDASQETRVSFEEAGDEFTTPSSQLHQQRANAPSDLPGLDRGGETLNDDDLPHPPQKHLLLDATFSARGPGCSPSHPIMISNQDAAPPPSSPPISPNLAEQSPDGSPGSTDEAGPATSHSCAYTIQDEASSSPSTRLRVRQGAYSAALEGRWSDNPLKSTCPREDSVEL